jgi:DNA-binding MarR family transcriptional regulator
MPSLYTTSESRIARRDKIFATIVLVPPFSFLTNHGAVLLCIAEDPRMRMRDIAATVDITERAAQRIVADLIDTGYVERTRNGRRNSYTIRTDLTVALPAQRDIALQSLLTVLLPSGSSTARREGLEAGHPH